MGFPRDDCAYGGSCDVNIGGTHIGDGIWDYVTYMEINHSSITPAAAAAIIPDLDGVLGTPTRHEVYSWELTNPLPNYLSEGVPEEPFPTCHTNTWSPPLNRRVISAAVVDCSQLTGTTTIKPEAWVDLFLTEPMGVYDGANDLYAEIMGPSDQGASTIVWHLLRLVE
jgi:hypothetical protein